MGRVSDTFFQHHALLCDQVTMANIRHGEGSAKHRWSQFIDSITEENADLLLDASFALAHLIAPAFKIPGIHHAENIHFDFDRAREIFDSGAEAYAQFKGFREASRKNREAILHRKNASPLLTRNFHYKLLKHQSKRQSRKKRIEVALAAIATLSSGLSITSLITEHAVHIAAATTIAPIAAFGLAVHQFAKAMKTTKAAWRAHKKTDPSYLWLDHYAKLDLVNRHIKQMQQRINELRTLIENTENAINNYNGAEGADKQIQLRVLRDTAKKDLSACQLKMKKLQLKQGRLALQVEALYQQISKEAGELDPTNYFSGKHFNKTQLQNFRDAYHEYKLRPKPNISKKIAKAIRESMLSKQRNKRSKLVKRSLLRYAGAIGLTLLAVAAIPTVGHLVLGIGIAITAAVAVAKAYHVYKHWNNHHLKASEKAVIDKKTHFVIDEFTVSNDDKAVLDTFSGSTLQLANTAFLQHILLQQMNETGPHKISMKKLQHDLSAVTDPERQLQFERALQQYKKRAVIAFNYHKQTRDDHYTLNDFLNDLDSMPLKQSDQLLRKSEQRYRQDMYLCSHKLDNAATASDKQQFLQALSSKQRTRLIKHCVRQDSKADKARPHHAQHHRTAPRTRQRLTALNAGVIGARTFIH